MGYQRAKDHTDRGCLDGSAMCPVAMQASVPQPKHKQQVDSLTAADPLKMSVATDNGIENASASGNENNSEDENENENENENTNDENKDKGGGIGIDNEIGHGDNDHPHYHQPQSSAGVLRCLDSSHRQNCERCFPPPEYQESQMFMLSGDKGLKNGEKKLRYLMQRSPEWLCSEKRTQAADACKALGFGGLEQIIRNKEAPGLRKSHLLYLAKFWDYKCDLWRPKKNFLESRQIKHADMYSTKVMGEQRQYQMGQVQIQGLRQMDDEDAISGGSGRMQEGHVESQGARHQASGGGNAHDENRDGGRKASYHQYYHYPAFHYSSHHPSSYCYPHLHPHQPHPHLGHPSMHQHSQGIEISSHGAFTSPSATALKRARRGQVPSFQLPSAPAAAPVPRIAAAATVTNITADVKTSSGAADKTITSSGAAVSMGDRGGQKNPPMNQAYSDPAYTVPNYGAVGSGNIDRFLADQQGFNTLKYAQHENSKAITSSFSPDLVPCHDNASATGAAPQVDRLAFGNSMAASANMLAPPSSIALSPRLFPFDVNTSTVTSAQPATADSHDPNTVPGPSPGLDGRQLYEYLNSRVGPIVDEMLRVGLNSEEFRSAEKILWEQRNQHPDLYQLRFEKLRTDVEKMEKHLNKMRAQYSRDAQELPAALYISIFGGSIEACPANALLMTLDQTTKSLASHDGRQVLILSLQRVGMGEIAETTEYICSKYFEDPLATQVPPQSLAAWYTRGISLMLKVVAELTSITMWSKSRRLVDYFNTASAIQDFLTELFKALYLLASEMKFYPVRADPNRR